MVRRLPSGPRTVRVWRDGIVGDDLRGDRHLFDFRAGGHLAAHRRCDRHGTADAGGSGSRLADGECHRLVVGDGDAVAGVDLGQIDGLADLQGQRLAFGIAQHDETPRRVDRLHHRLATHQFPLQHAGRRLEDWVSVMTGGGGASLPLLLLQAAATRQAKPQTAAAAALRVPTSIIASLPAPTRAHLCHGFALHLPPRQPGRHRWRNDSRSSTLRHAR